MSIQGDIPERRSEQFRKHQTLNDLLRFRASQSSPESGYVFLNDEEIEESRLSFKELDRRAKSIAAALRQVEASGARALLLYPPGLDFIKGFFGCLYAGIVAIPAYPPDASRLNRTLPRLQSIAADARATIVLTTSQILSTIKGPFANASDLEALNWLATDAMSDDLEHDWKEPRLTGEQIAFLQYTSGSTGTPRGVMLTHANL